VSLNFAGLGKETTHNTSRATFYKRAKPGDEAEMRCFPSGNSSFVRQGLKVVNSDKSWPFKNGFDFLITKTALLVELDVGYFRFFFTFSDG